MRSPAVALIAFAAAFVLVAIAPAFIGFPIAVAVAAVWCFLLEREQR